MSIGNIKIVSNPFPESALTKIQANLVLFLSLQKNNQ